jgi:solute carrier family 25 phosphate transporter 3
MKQLFSALLCLQGSVAFQQSYNHCARNHGCRSTHVDDFIPKHEEQFDDVLDRRVFVRNALLTLSILSIKPDNALAAIDDVASAPVATTPSTLEGELTVSSPPPNRVIVTDDEDTSSKSVTKVSKKKASDPRFFIAGGASAAISHGITTPIDVVKTKMQGDASLSDLSPSEAALRIVEAEGPKALAAGLGPTVIGYGVEGALKFGVYETLKPIFLSLADGIEVTDPTQPYLVAAICAGALASIILCPMEETRIKLVTDPSFANGLLDGLPKIVKEEGILSPFEKGLAPMLAKQVPYTMGKQVSFDLFAGMLYGTLLGFTFLPKNGIALEVEVGAAFLASIVACLASHPGDVLLTATYKNSNGTNGNFLQTIQRVYQDGGISAFFRGLNARFIHVGCIITFQLVIYDQIKQSLGLPASGT